MKPLVLYAVTTKNIGTIPKNDLVAYNEDGEQILFLDAQLNLDDIKVLIDNNDGILNHMVNSDIHWSKADRREYEDYMKTLSTHVATTAIHVTLAEKNTWNSKETEEGAQQKANVVKDLLDIHAGDLDVHVTKLEKDRWNNTYTREEVSNIISIAQTKTSYKEPVDTYDDLATTYPEPKDGWMCVVQDTDITYIYTTDYMDEDGTVSDKWVVWGINAIPYATENNGGKITKEDYIKLQNIENNANYYVHPNNSNCRHVTDTEKAIWSNKASTAVATIFTAGLMSSSDKIKIDTVEKYANHYEHPDTHEPSIIAEDDQHRFVTSAQIESWTSKPSGELASDEHDGQMSKEDYIKLYNIEENANHYVHPTKHSSTDIAEDTNHRFVTDKQIAAWNAKEDQSNSQDKADYALTAAKMYTDDAIKNLVGSSVETLDTIQELAAALGDDPNFSATIMTMLSEKLSTTIFTTHANDYSMHLSVADRAKFETIEENANYYIHPETHSADMIEETSTRRFITDNERTIWNNKANDVIATEATSGVMSPAMVRKLNSITTTGKVTSDWNETDEDSGSYIRNKPESLPANGGTAEKVMTYDLDDLIHTRRSNAYVIACSSINGAGDKYADYVYSGSTTEDVGEAIRNAIDNVESGTILIREGTYYLSSPITITKGDIAIKGCPGTVINIVTGGSIAINYDGVTIEGIKFTSSVSSYLITSGNKDNVIRDCIIESKYGIELKSARTTKISGCKFTCSNCAISINVDDSSSFDSYGNIVEDNNFSGMDDANGATISINSSGTKTNSSNIITHNTIQDCYNGIIMTNDALNDSMNLNNLITSNSITRGIGLPTDYLYEQHTVRIKQGSYNMVSNNILAGREAVAESGINNLIINNISVGDNTATS